MEAACTSAIGRALMNVVRSMPNVTSTPSGTKEAHAMCSICSPWKFIRSSSAEPAAESSDDMTRMALTQSVAGTGRMLIAFGLPPPKGSTTGRVCERLTWEAMGGAWAAMGGASKRMGRDASSWERASASERPPR